MNFITLTSGLCKVKNPGWFHEHKRSFHNEDSIIGAISIPYRRRCELAGEARGRLMGRPSFSTLLATTGLLTLPSRFIF